MIYYKKYNLICHFSRSFKRWWQVRIAATVLAFALRRFLTVQLKKRVALLILTQFGQTS